MDCPLRDTFWLSVSAKQCSPIFMKLLAFSLFEGACVGPDTKLEQPRQRAADLIHKLQVF